MVARGIIVTLTLLYSLFFTPIPSFSETLNPVEEQTVKALRLAKENRWREARQIITDTRDPLAIKIYHWALYTQNPRDSNFVRLAQFVRQNPDWPGMRHLRQKAESDFPEDLPSRAITAWFDDFPPLTSKGLHIYLSALKAQGKTRQLQSVLQEWWASSLMPRNDQIFLFKTYRSYLTDEAHRERLDNLLFARHYTNARAIASVLGDDYEALAEARIALAEEKPGVDNYIRRVPASLKNDAGLIYERMRWRRRHDLNERTIELLDQARKVEGIRNPSSWWRERHIVIRRLLEDKRFEESYRLASQHIQKDGFSYAQAEWLAGFIALRLNNRPDLAVVHFENLYQNVSTPISLARGAYWAGRAHQELGQQEDADRWLGKAAQFQTTYYGQMAAAETRADNSILAMAPPQLTPEESRALSAHPLIRAAMIFQKAGFEDEAGQFLYAFVASRPGAKEYKFAADKALSFGTIHQAVRLSKDATHKGFFLTAQSYPMMTEALRGVDIEWALVHALIRQESLFDKGAQSPAGALGLMQIMPATAKEVSRKLGIRHETSMLLSDPAHNIRLGTTYLHELLERFEGSYPLAIAAYNAGPNRVRQWLQIYGDPRRGEIDIIDWIELIPIYETRNYVQRVVEGTYVYRHRLQGIQKPPNVVINMATPENLRAL